MKKHSLTDVQQLYRPNIQIAMQTKFSKLTVPRKHNESRLKGQNEFLARKNAYRHMRAVVAYCKLIYRHLHRRVSRRCPCKQSSGSSHRKSHVIVALTADGEAGPALLTS